MKAQGGRSHGVTPELNRDYSTRTANRQAAFVLPYLRPGMDLLDIGCGPGTISLGLAKAVVPGRVSGVDHDAKHVQQANRSVAEQGVTNATFLRGDVLILPFPDAQFDVVFENNVFTHLADRAEQAAREVYRVLKPGGLFAARDVNVEAVLWGGLPDALQPLDKLFIRWHHSRGSDITIGRRLPALLREAGFGNTVKSVSADTKGDSESTRAHADMTSSLLDGPFGQALLDNGWAPSATVENMKKAIHRWGEDPDAFFANVHVEVIGWKPD